MKRDDDEGEFRRPEEQQLLKIAAQFLDAETDAMDVSTRSALARARATAAEARRKQWLQMPWLIWGGAGVGAALAASLTVLVILPQGSGTGTDATVANLLAAQEHAFDRKSFHESGFSDGSFNEVALVDDTEAAVADDLAFIAWLEENHDPS